MNTRSFAPIVVLLTQPLFTPSAVLATPPTRCNLFVEQIRLTYDGKLFITVKNGGTAAVPSSAGRLRVFVDHWTAADIDLSTAWPVSLRDPGESAELDAGVRIHGARRRVLTVIDPDNAVAELNEFDQSMSIDLSAPTRTGFDLSVVAGIMQQNGQKRVYFTVRNVGNMDTPPNMPVIFRVYNSAGTLVGTSSQLLPTIQAGCDIGTCPNVDCSTGTCQTGACVTGLCDVYIAPTTNINFPEFDQAGLHTIRATLDLLNFPDLDSVNNTFEAKIRYVTRANVDPTNPATDYGAMLAANSGRIKSVMSWPPANTCPQNQTCPTTFYAFDSWPATGGYGDCAWPGHPPFACPTQQRLGDCLFALEQGREFPISDPLGATVLFNTIPLIPQHAAVDIYVESVAQALWFNIHAAGLHSVVDPAWDLEALDEATLHLTAVDPDHLLYVSGSNSAGVYYYGGAASPGNPRRVYDFLAQSKIIKPTQSATVWALSDWWRTHVAHGDPSSRSNPPVNWGYAGSQPADNIFYPLEPPGSYSHLAQFGCGSTARLWQLGLATVNIPVVRESVNLQSGGHGTLSLPTVRKSCDGPGEPACCVGLPCCANPPCADTPGVRLHHGDDLLSVDMFPTHPEFAPYVPGQIAGPHDVPSWAIWYSFEESQMYYDAVLPVDCDPVSQLCNYEGLQRAYNWHRRMALLASEYLPVNWLRWRACELSCAGYCPGNVDCTALESNTGYLQAYCLEYSNDVCISYLYSVNTVLTAAEASTFRQRLDTVIAYVGGSPFSSLGVSRGDRPNYLKPDPSETNAGPTAVASAVAPLLGAGCVISLDSAGTTDTVNPGPDATLKYLWTSDDASVLVARPSASKALFVAPIVGGNRTFRVMASDGANMSTASVTASIPSGSNPDLAACGEGGRYLAISPAAGATSVALLVSSIPGASPCVAVYVKQDTASPFDLDLDVTPEYRLPANWTTTIVDGGWTTVLSTVFVGDQEVRPSTQYEVRTARSGSLPDLSEPVTATTWQWGETNGVAGVNFQDVSTVNDAFQGKVTPGSRFRSDLKDADPNGTINFLDTSAATAAFQGNPFPYAPPGATCVCTTDASCNNGLYCDGVEHCVGGVCEGGTAVFCVDSFACTVDTCNESTDSCLFVPSNAPCQDGLFCNGVETCSLTQGCVAGSNPCGAFTCNEATDSCGGGPQ